MKEPDRGVPSILLQCSAAHGFNLLDRQVQMLDGVVLGRAAHRRPPRTPWRHDQHRRGAAPGPRPEHRPEIRDPGPRVQSDHHDFERERAAPEIELGPAVSDGDTAGFEMIEHWAEDVVRGQRAKLRRQSKLETIWWRGDLTGHSPCSAPSRSGPQVAPNPVIR